MNFPSLSSFLAGYLHQDWDLEYGDPAEAVVDFIRSEPTATVRATVNDLNALISLDLSDDELQRWLLDVGCYYQPSGPVREWLLALHEQLARQAGQE